MKLIGYHSDSVFDDLPVGPKKLPKHLFCSYCNAYLHKKIGTQDEIKLKNEKFSTRKCCCYCKREKGNRGLREYLWWLLEQLSKKRSLRGSGKRLNKIGNVSKLLKELGL